MNRKILSALAMSLTAAMLIPAHGAAQSSSNSTTNYLVFSLPTLGGSVGAGNAINDRSWVIGASNIDDQTVHAALWIYGTPFDLGTLGGPNSAVLWPIHNTHGQISGVAETADLDPLGEAWSCSAFFPTVTGHVCRGFLWHDGSMIELPTLGGDNGYAAGMNNHGQVVGWAENTTHDPTCNAPQVLQFEAVVWGPNGHVQALPPYGSDPDGAATSINDAGQVVGISGTCSNAVGGFSAAHAVLWQGGAPKSLGTLGGIAWNTPADINNRGEVVGFSDLAGDDNGSPNFHAFLWTQQSGMQDLGTLIGDTYSEALGINERGQVVGTSCTAGFASCRAFIWQNGTMTDLNALIASGSVSLTFANDINDRGEISGGAFDPSTGDSPAFIAVSAPEGSSTNAAIKVAPSTRNPGLRLGPFGRLMK